MIIYCLRIIEEERRWLKEIDLYLGEISVDKKVLNNIDQSYLCRVKGKLSESCSTYVTCRNSSPTEALHATCGRSSGAGGLSE